MKLYKLIGSVSLYNRRIPVFKDTEGRMYEQEIIADCITSFITLTPNERNNLSFKFIDNGGYYKLGDEPVYLESKLLEARQAYGRKHSPYRAELDWNEGRDFQCILSGSYFSSRDIELLKEDGYTGIKVGELIIEF